MGASFEMVCNQAAWVFDEWRRYIDRINIGKPMEMTGGTIKPFS